MNEKRMPKGWTHVGDNSFETAKTESRKDVIRREKRNIDKIRNTATMSEEKLMEKTLISANEKEAFQKQLVEAFEQKKLKSKRLIKAAKAIIKKNSAVKAS